MIKLILLLFAATLITACNNQKNSANTVVEKNTVAKAGFATTEKAELTISGMTCAVGCAGTIQKNLARIEGVQSVEVDFDKRLAMVEYNPETVVLDDLKNTVHNTADTYKVLDIKNVKAFSKEDLKENEHSACSTNCKKEYCKDKKMDQANATASCNENCTKSCCAQKM